jgi:hypothetical protein
MKLHLAIDYGVYALLIILSLVALLLILNAPDLLETRVVYQGF